MAVDSRSTEAVLRRSPLVLASVLLDTAVLGRPVLLAAGVTTLCALDVGVRSAAVESVTTNDKREPRGDIRSAKTVLGRETLVGGTVLLEAVVLESQYQEQDCGVGCVLSATEGQAGGDGWRKAHLRGLVGRHRVLAFDVLIKDDER